MVVITKTIKEVIAVRTEVLYCGEIENAVKRTWQYVGKFYSM